MSRLLKLERVAEAAREWLAWEKAGCPDIERMPHGVLEKRLAELDGPVALAYREWWEDESGL